MKFEVAKFARKIVTTTKQKAPMLMSIGAGAGVVATVYFFVKAKPEVDDIWAEAKAKIEEIKAKKAEKQGAEASESEEKPAKKAEEVEKSIKEEVMKVRWSAMKRTLKACKFGIAAGIMTEVLIFGANAENTKRIAEISTMYDISQKLQKQYQSAVKETVGEKEEEKIREAYAKKRVEEAKKANPTIYDTGLGEVLYVDEWTGERFRASYNALETAKNSVNDMLNKGDEYVAVNEFRSLTHRPPCKFGEQNGWCADTGLLDLYYTATVTDDGEHAIMVSYDVSRKFKTNSWGEYVY